MIMKSQVQSKIHKKFLHQDKFYGVTTIGARGQLVIPALARKELGLSPGDQLVVMGKFGKLLGLMKTEAMASFVETMMDNLAGTGMEVHAKKHFDKMFKNLKGINKV